MTPPDKTHTWRSTQTHDVLQEIQRERECQDRRWGEQNHPMHSTNPHTYAHYHQSEADTQKRINDTAVANQGVTWDQILNEELHEARAEIEWPVARAEWVQVAAVVALIIEQGDRDNTQPDPTIKPGTISSEEIKLVTVTFGVPPNEYVTRLEPELLKIFKSDASKFIMDEAQEPPPDSEPNTTTSVKRRDCYAYQDHDTIGQPWKNSHSHFYPDGPMG
jgi:hypothetical protein